MRGRIVLTIADADGDKATVSVNCLIPDDTVAADISDFFPFSLWLALHPLVNGELIEAHTEVISDISLWANHSPPATISDIQEQAEFTFRTALSAPFRTVLRIPTFVETLFTGSGAGKVVDTTNVDVIAFTTVMTEDVASSGISATDRHWLDLSVFIKAVQRFGKG